MDATITLRFDLADAITARDVLRRYMLTVAEKRRWFGLRIDMTISGRAPVLERALAHIKAKVEEAENEMRIW